jgi:hypothetical protein
MLAGVRRFVLQFDTETDGLDDPLFQDFLKDFGLGHLNAIESASLRTYLTHLGRKWAELEATTTTIQPEDHAAFLRALDAEPTDYTGRRLSRQKSAMTKWRSFGMRWSMLTSHTIWMIFQTWSRRTRSGIKSLL